MGLQKQLLNKYWKQTDNELGVYLRAKDLAKEEMQENSSTVLMLKTENLSVEQRRERTSSTSSWQWTVNGYETVLEAHEEAFSFITIQSSSCWVEHILPP